MTTEIELPKGLRVIVEVDLRYWRGRLEPFQFLFKNQRYKISRITRRRKKRIDDRETQHYWIRIENQRGAFELIEDVKSALWTLRRVEEPKRNSNRRSSSKT